MTGQESYGATAFCKAFGISRSQLDIELRTHRLQAKKLGNRIFITREHAQAWLDNLPDYEPAA